MYGRRIRVLSGGSKWVQAQPVGSKWIRALPGERMICMENNRAYARIRRFLICLFHLIFPMKVTGRENLPAEGACILCSNHLSDWDPFLLACALPRQVVFLAKKELFETPVVRWFVKKMGAFPVNRGSADLSAIRKCMSVVKEGEVLGIFPQGHRYKADDHRKLESGAALVALRTRTPIVPVHISAPLRCFHRVRIEVGAPVELADLFGKSDAASLETATQRLTDAIWHD